MTLSTVEPAHRDLTVTELLATQFAGHETAGLWAEAARASASTENTPGSNFWRVKKPAERLVVGQFPMGRGSE